MVSKIIPTKILEWHRSPNLISILTKETGVDIVVPVSVNSLRKALGVEISYVTITMFPGE